ncbi:heterokaryon incompatibility protein-domain-containing protein [Hypoxylon trugodes]|uniref:heterokaryon incompatibility protein-domain-containing protein n=1 Tax=Hypoxylon trugodes TaxID=326681 RepID=UPI00219CC7DB|nr:heterokaryon incompatibility protein-domain-containing protein [Hypoxylon trugodes]KAI1388441.1 heterokaryon incompatibility protein-domain-containing protein [Hypoxylon trugodes]
MRLINTRDYEMKEWLGDQVPNYAILSHTWEEGEVTFQDWQHLNDEIRKKAGYDKIMGACRQAREDGLDWLWVDTNCIDKTSSAELSEAINSMFAWYRDAKICYAYLQDVPTGLTVPNENEVGTDEADIPDEAEVTNEGDETYQDYTDDEYDTDEEDELPESFHNSRWFTRGWTLQELLAPDTVVFYARDWTTIGALTPSMWGVRGHIARITGIDSRYLYGSENSKEASVSERLSWVANRKTTRTEDIAYCLLGLFDINMPLLYGEGIKAFTRLQHEIIRNSSDHTIFCWKWSNAVPADWVSILAPFPSVFAESGNYIRRDEVAAAELLPYSMTNIGLSIQLPVIYGRSYVFAILNAGRQSREFNRYAAIPLRITLSRKQFDRYRFPPEPILLDFPGLKVNEYAERDVYSGPAPCEQLIIRSAFSELPTRGPPRRLPRSPPPPYKLDRYNILIIIDAQCSFSRLAKTPLSLESGTDYFRVVSNPPPKRLIDTIPLVRIEEKPPILKESPPIYASLVKIVPTEKDRSFSILFMVKSAVGGSGLPDQWSCHAVPDDYDEILARASLEIDVLPSESTETSYFSRKDGDWCVKLGHSFTTSNDSEVRVVQIYNEDGYRHSGVPVREGGSNSACVVS